MDRHGNDQTMPDPDTNSLDNVWQTAGVISSRNLRFDVIIYEARGFLSYEYDSNYQAKPCKLTEVILFYECYFNIYKYYFLKMQYFLF